MELSGKLAFQPDVLLATERIVANAVTTWMNARTGGKTGGILVRHRFGSTLNLHIHAHLLVVDGGYTMDERGCTFRAAPAIREDALNTLAQTIRARIHGLFKRRGLLQHDDVNNETPELDARAMC